MKEKRNKFILVSLSLSFIFLLFFDTTLSFSQDDKSHLDPPGLIRSSAITQAYSAESNQFTGISSMAVSPGGRIWATWYAGINPGEDQNNYVVVSTSGDQGDTWEEVLVIDPVHDQVRAYDPEIWVDPDGEWVLPVSIWEMTEGSAQMVVSGDRVKTWYVRGAASVRRMI